MIYQDWLTTALQREWPRALWGASFIFLNQSWEEYLPTLLPQTEREERSRIVLREYRKQIKFLGIFKP